VVAGVCAAHGVDRLIIDDFALEPMTRDESSDLYQLFEQTARAATIVTSNRDTSESASTFRCLGTMLGFARGARRSCDSQSRRVGKTNPDLRRQREAHTGRGGHPTPGVTQETASLRIPSLQRTHHAHASGLEQPLTAIDRPPINRFKKKRGAGQS
jgi:hypothetical protein